MTPAKLRRHTCKDLAQMAKAQGVPGWHSMRKDELIGALVRNSRRKSSKQRSQRNSDHKTNTSKPAPVGLRTSSGPRGAIGKDASTDPRIKKRMSQLQSMLEEAKDLGEAGSGGRQITDRLVVMVRDPYWLHAFWELSTASVERARAALAESWHAAKPILRLFKITTNGTATIERDIEIHGGVKNWYLDVQDPPSTYRLEIGYRTESNSFFCLARSNSVTTPPAGTCDAIDENWADVAENADRIFAMSGGYSPGGTSQELQELLEERLRRPMGSPMTTRFGSGAVGGDSDGFLLAIDAELIVYGVSRRDAHVTLKGEPVHVRQDGTFTVRLSLPERRQVIPVVACSADGVEQRTIVLAVERNTKIMGPVVRDIVG